MSAGLPRPSTSVVVVDRTLASATETCLHAESGSAVFRFVDDAAFCADESAGMIQVRSASRVGSSDLDVNRRRIETIRERKGEPPPR